MYNKKESGQVIIIVAAGLVALLIFAALAVDLGAAYSAKRDAQNAADAAAMAGARQIVLECNNGAAADEENILAQVRSLMAVNAPNATYEVYFIDSSGDRLASNQVGSVGEVPCQCGAGRAQGLEVIVHNETDSFIAGAIGQETLGADAHAKAAYNQVIYPAEGIGLYPVTRKVGVPIVRGDDVQIRDVKGGEDIPGNFGWLTWAGSPDAGTLVTSMTPPGDSYTFVNAHDPSDHTISIGDWVEGATGNMANLKKTLDDEWVRTGEIMIFPLYDEWEGTGSGVNYRVAGFAAVEIDGYSLGGSDKYIQAHFVDAVVTGDWVNASCADETGLYSIRLTAD